MDYLPQFVHIARHEKLFRVAIESSCPVGEVIIVNCFQLQMKLQLNNYLESINHN